MMTTSPEVRNYEDINRTSRRITFPHHQHDLSILHRPSPSLHPTAWEPCPSTPTSFSAPTSILPNDSSLDSFNSSSSGPASVEDDIEDLLACGLLADELAELELLEAKYSNLTSHAVQHTDTDGYGEAEEGIEENDESFVVVVKKKGKLL
jgi:hypothetical protein